MKQEQVTKIADSAHQRSINEKIKRGEPLKDYDHDFLKKQSDITEKLRKGRKEMLSPNNLSPDTLGKYAQNYSDEYEVEAKRRILHEYGINIDDIPEPLTLDDFVKSDYGGKD